MKRINNLYEQIAGRENLCLAFWKAARGKRGRKEVQAFSRDFDRRIEEMMAELHRQQPRIGQYRFFHVRDPKQRLICAAPFPERVLQHAVMNLCEPVLERYAIFDSYACRRGKGLHRALSRAQEFAGKNPWYLKLDINKYFDSIDHGILLTHLGRRFKDPKLLALFARLLATYNTSPGKGLPIGNLVSQHFANFYLGVFDHWLKEERRARFYLRYMDDFVLFAASREALQEELARLRGFLAEHLRLDLKENIQLNRTAHGIPFLGFRIYPWRILLGPASRRRFVRKFRYGESLYLAGEWSEGQLARHVAPLVAFTRPADAAGFRRQIIAQYGRIP